MDRPLTEIIKAIGNEAGVERFYREVDDDRLPYDFTGWEPSKVAACLVNHYFSRRPPLRGA